MKRLFISVFFILLLLAGEASADTWAVYMYFCGSDLETRFGAASLDIAEAAGATLPPEVSIVIQTGGTKQWKNEFISSQSLQRWTVSGKNQLERVDEQPQASMGDESTLASFLNFCSKNYPADHKILVIWDHGGGSLWGIANDENYKRDSLSLKELRGALRRVYGNKPSAPPFEIIGFDACLMATLDTACAVQEYARYMVASQEQEAGTGWDYTGWLNALGKKTAMSGIELGRVICDTYKQSCLKEDTHGKETLSVTDLAKIPALNMLYNAVGFEALRRRTNDDKFLTTYARCINNSENYVNSKTQGYTNMADLGSILRQLQRELPEFAPKTLKMLRAAVPYQIYGPQRNPSGLSCYYPFDGDKKNYSAMIKNRTMTSFLLLQGLQFNFIDRTFVLRQANALTVSMASNLVSLPTASRQNLQESSPQPGQSVADAVTGGVGSLGPGAAANNTSESIGAIAGSALQGTTQVLGSNAAPTSHAHESDVSSLVLAGITSVLGAPAAKHVASFIQQGISDLSNAYPLQGLNTANLEDHDVEIGEGQHAGAWLKLGPRNCKFLESVHCYVALYSAKDDIILGLGTDRNIESDWERGEFKDNFSGTWAALDGHFVYLDIIGQDEHFNFYSVPILLNGEKRNLSVVYDFDKSEYIVQGTRRPIGENGAADKILVPLREGDRITTLLQKMSISGDDDFEEVEADEFTLGKSWNFKDMGMGDGTFFYLFVMTDIQKNSASSEVVHIEVKGNNISYEKIAEEP